MAASKNPGEALERQFLELMEAGEDYNTRVQRMFIQQNKRIEELREKLQEPFRRWRQLREKVVVGLNQRLLEAEKAAAAVLAQQKGKRGKAATELKAHYEDLQAKIEETQRQIQGLEKIEEAPFFKLEDSEELPEIAGQIGEEEEEESDDEDGEEGEDDDESEEE